MREIFIYGLLVVYFIYSLAESISFYKRDTNYSKKYKRIHTILIWIIPFIYVLLLKELDHRALGSNHYDKKNRNLGSKGNNDYKDGQHFDDNFTH